MAYESSLEIEELSMKAGDGDSLVLVSWDVHGLGRVGVGRNNDGAGPTWSFTSWLVSWLCGGGKLSTGSMSTCAIGASDTMGVVIAPSGGWTSSEAIHAFILLDGLDDDLEGSSLFGGDHGDWEVLGPRARPLI